MLLYLVDLFK